MVDIPNDVTTAAVELRCEVISSDFFVDGDSNSGSATEFAVEPDNLPSIPVNDFILRGNADNIGKTGPARR